MRIVSVRYGVEDIDRALDCYVRCLGLEVVSRTQIGGHEVAAVSAGKRAEGCKVILSLTRQLQKECPRPSNAFAAFGLVVPNLKEVVDSLYHHGYGTPISRARVPYLLRLPSFHSPCQDAGQGHGLESEATPVVQFAFVRDPAGYTFELMEASEAATCHLTKVGLFVSDLERSVDFYEKALGMRLRHRCHEPRLQGTGFRSAILGFADPELEPSVEARERAGITCQEVVLEVTERGDIAGSSCVGTVSIVLETDDVAAARDALMAAGAPLNVREAPDLFTRGRVNSLVLQTSDPDGWSFVILQKSLRSDEE